MTTLNHVSEGRAGGLALPAYDAAHWSPHSPGKDERKVKAKKRHTQGRADTMGRWFYTQKLLYPMKEPTILGQLAEHELESHLPHRIRGEQDQSPKRPDRYQGYTQCYTKSRPLPGLHHLSSAYRDYKLTPSPDKASNTHKEPVSSAITIITASAKYPTPPTSREPHHKPPPPREASQQDSLVVLPPSSPLRPDATPRLARPTHRAASLATPSLCFLLLPPMPACYPLLQLSTCTHARHVKQRGKEGIDAGERAEQKIRKTRPISFAIRPKPAWRSRMHAPYPAGHRACMRGSAGHREGGWAGDIERGPGS
ncbi:hypothetical protein O3P69_001419 [Scylla paramamosain]|uniref:Uncharacterized protein n=1 Tax=Scylla paramamosain TaxID=85552 RepID=A0AAW0V038_SCYPA